ncbi:MAG: ATP-binding protein [Oscillatoriaceae bacterium SKW80]|nr:ATP-binding protein [Oscillatoriaceae bacterium SKYG93]MCX8121894.1 ATP-binding protein [Oscillatoriaceae bacterium SKW80]MDW8454655.1 ATP-binding protein [Oscillatoriaceae cyanobacterium SKYGB_i_bin93]HIK28640.1 ATP-binding protein [Oscillatoriaceae cyanobacterium M7585_C2015_266]
MASIYEIIRQEMNPFDSTTFRPGNFWQEYQDPAFTVESIHQEVIAEVEELLEKVAQDHRTRTLLLAGDSGSGKSYLLGRLKNLLNQKAFFAYIGPWPDSDFIWRHVLRNTVDSLMYAPDGQKESQLLLWLKSLSALRDESIWKQIFSERNLFIRNLKSSYPNGIYNANEFFGVLYALTNSELYPLACEWLKGDDLDEETLKLLKVKRAINSEDMALRIISNFGKISSATQPIVLCFDNLDNIDRAEDGLINLQALFNFNSLLHNQKLKNFLVIISIVTNTWKQNSRRIIQADLARLDKEIRLQSINLDQAEALWKCRMYPIHQKTDPKPRSPIFPLTRKHLEDKFPGGKTRPRYVLMLGRQLFQEAKTQIESPDSKLSLALSQEPLAAFQLLWLKEFSKIQEKIYKVRQFSAPELIQMLREALTALQMHSIQPKLLPSKTYASYSFSYQLPFQKGRIGIVWMEEPNLTSFCHLMRACEKAVKRGLCQNLYLIRGESVGGFGNQGYKIYNQVFVGTRHRHLKPDISSLHYLATYHSLVNAACAGELVIGERTRSLNDLEALTRKSKVLRDCRLLQMLGVFTGSTQLGDTDNNIPELSQPFHDVKEFLLNLVKTQQIIGRQVLCQNARSQFPLVNQFQLAHLIDELCREKQIFILDPNAAVEAQLICLANK